MKRLNKYAYNSEKSFPCNGKRNQVRTDTCGNEMPFIAFEQLVTYHYFTIPHLSIRITRMYTGRHHTASGVVSYTSHPCRAPKQCYPPGGGVAALALLPAWSCSPAELPRTTSARASFLLPSGQFIAKTF